MAQRIRTNQQEIVAFKANRTAALSIPNITFTKITYGNESFDTHNAHNVSTGVFTVPYSGYYTIFARISIDAISANSRGILTLYKNGSEFERLDMVIAGGVSADLTLRGSSLCNLTAGDTVEVYVWQGSGSAKNIEVVAHYSEFSGYLVARM